VIQKSSKGYHSILPNNLSPKEKVKAGILKPVKGPSGGARGNSIVSGSERFVAADLNTPVKGQMGSNMSHQISPTSVMNGYLSQGQSDAGSARLSNVQTFKYNPINNIRKVSP
jgi:hypothetical protein